MRRLFTRRAGAFLVVVAAGLALRRYALDLGAPFFFWKYGGSLLWGMMVYFLTALLLGSVSKTRIIAVASLAAVAVEFFRLVHAPWLDAFRLTTAGALLLGRVFSLWNIVAYLAGIALGALIEAALGLRT